MTLKRKRGIFYDRFREGAFSSLLILYLLLAGCGQEGAVTGPEEGPEVVVERFYGYISEAKIKGGGTPAREAFKLIDAESSQYRVEQFLEVIKKYPSGFKADVGEVKTDGDRALATISYKMPSMFNDGYTRIAEIPLIIDKATNAWKIDFTGESDSMDQETAGASQVDVAPQDVEIKESKN